MTTSPAADAARQFYRAFSDRDAEAMARITRTAPSATRSSAP